MKKFNSNIRKTTLLFFTCISAVFSGYAQEWVSSYPTVTANASLTNGGITFEVESTEDVLISRLLGTFHTSGSSVNIWYRIGGVIHQPGNNPNISPANGWVRYEANIPINPPGLTVPDTVPLLTPLFLPANVPVGIFVENAARFRRWIAGNPAVFSDNVVTLRTGSDVGFSGQAPLLSNNSQFAGGVEYNTLDSCSGTPNPGNTIATPAVVCRNTSVNLSTENRPEIGQSFQWQYSYDNSTWVDLEDDTIASASLEVDTNSWFRVIVSCDGSTETSNSVQVNVIDELSGSYTIDQNSPSSSSNFQSFRELSGILTCIPLTGPVEIEIVTGSGPYNEQILLGEISGASATNTLTIKGNGESIEFNNSGMNDPAIVRLSGSQYVILDSLHILSLSPQRAWGIHLINQANENIIRNCVIDISSVTSQTGANSAGIIAAGNNTTVTQAANANNNIIENNRILGGTNGGPHQGISIAGDGQNSSGNAIRNNEITDFNLFGIRVHNAPDNTIEGNVISRPQRIFLGDIRGIYLTSGSNGILIRNNEIFGLHANTNPNTNAVYGISNAATGSFTNTTLVYNNLIHSFEGGGIQHGLHNQANGAHYFHNTVVFNDPDAVNQGANGFYNQGNNNEIDVFNNIFYMDRNTSAQQYAIRIQQDNVNVYSDHNLFYLGNNAGVGIRASNGNTSLQDWIDASENDESSQVNNPLFTDISGGDFRPTSAIIKSMGMDLQSDVPEDILGNSRPANPDPGVYQFDPADCTGPYAFEVDSLDIVDNEGGTALISWESASTSWIAEWGPCGFAPGEGEAAFMDSNVSSNTDFLIEIPLGECWCLYVQEECDPETQWSNPFEVCASAGVDAGINTLISPVDAECGLSRMNIVVEITNRGETPITSLPVFAEVRGDFRRDLSTTYTGNLQTNQTASVTVGSINSYSGSVIDVLAYVALTGDQNINNDSLLTQNIRIISRSPLNFNAQPTGDGMEFLFVSNRRNEIDSIVWDFAGLGSASGDSATFSFNSVDSFEVCMDVYGYCNSGTFCKMVYTDTTIIDDTLSTDLHALESSLQLYPNPSSGRVTLDFHSEEASDTRLVLFDMQGNQLMQEFLPAQQGHFSREFDLSNLSSAIYILRIERSGGSISKRLIIH